MKIRNKSTTWYREGKLVIKPKETVTITAHDGHELIRRFPWHFEEVHEPGKVSAQPQGEGSYGGQDKGAGSEPAGDSGAPAERPAPSRRGRDR